MTRFHGLSFFMCASMPFTLTPQPARGTVGVACTRTPTFNHSGNVAGACSERLEAMARRLTHARVVVRQRVSAFSCGMCRGHRSRYLGVAQHRCMNGHMLTYGALVCPYANPLPSLLRSRLIYLRRILAPTRPMVRGTSLARTDCTQHRFEPFLHPVYSTAMKYAGARRGATLEGVLYCDTYA